MVCVRQNSKPSVYIKGEGKNMFDIIERNGKKELFRWFQAVNKPMKVVVIPDDVEAMCNYTFNNRSVGQVDLIWMPDTITEIPMYCFYKCTARAIRMSRVFL